MSTVRELTAPEHEHTASIEECAIWLADHRGKLAKTVVEECRVRFGLTTNQAIEAFADSVKFDLIEARK